MVSFRQEAIAIAIAKLLSILLKIGLQLQRLDTNNLHILMLQQTQSN